MQGGHESRRQLWHGTDTGDGAVTSYKLMPRRFGAGVSAPEVRVGVSHPTPKELLCLLPSASCCASLSQEAEAGVTPIQR